VPAWPMTLGEADAGWPLVGRDQELNWLIRTCTGPTPSNAVLVGDLGVGKSRLVLELLRHAERRTPGPVHWVTATPAARHVPFGAFAGLLPDFPLSLGDRTLLRAAAAALTAGSTDRQVMVTVDDAHLLDDLSASLVHYLATSRLATVVVVVRPSEPTGEALTGLARNGFAARLDVAPLERGAFDRLVDHALPGGTTDGVRSELWARAAGSPLLLRELVTEGRASSALVCVRGSWRWKGGLPPGGRMAELVLARLAALDVRERAALELVAAGEPLEAKVVEALIDPPTLLALDRAALLKTSQHRGRLVVGLRDVLVGEVVRARTPDLVARSLRRRLAVAVAEAPRRRRDDELRLAVWRLEAGDPGDAEALRRACRRALSHLDLGLAERLARAAWESAIDPASGVLLALVLGWSGRTAEADELLSSLERRTPPADPGLAVRMAAARALLDHPAAGELSTQPGPAGREGTAPPTGDAGSDGNRSDLPLAAAVALTQLRRGRASAVLEGLRPSHESGGPAGAALGVPLALAAAACGRLAEAVAAADQVLSTDEAAGEVVPAPHALMASTRCAVLARLGRLDEADTLAVAHNRQAETAATAAPTGLWRLHLADLALWRGQARTASRLAAESAGALDDGDPLALKPAALALLVVAALLHGDRIRAGAARTELAAADHHSLRGTAFEGLAERAETAWRAAAGDRAGAAAEAATAAAGFGRDGRHLAALLSTFDLVRLSPSAETGARLVDVAGRVDGDLALALATVGAALRRGDGRLLASAAARVEGMGMLLHAAELHVLAADANRRGGDAVGAFGSGERARTLLSMCEGVALAAEAPAAVGGGLTPRERDIAALAATGLTNRQISGHLTISARTVENHLYRIFTKLGITSRAELTAAVTDQALTVAGSTRP